MSLGKDQESHEAFTQHWRRPCSLDNLYLTWRSVKVNLSLPFLSASISFNNSSPGSTVRPGRSQVDAAISDPEASRQPRCQGEKQ